jgi:hypothetical protein
MFILPLLGPFFTFSNHEDYKFNDLQRIDIGGDINVLSLVVDYLKTGEK